jgi:hypothetical protein
LSRLPSSWIISPHGVIRIDRVVEQLEVWFDQSFPFAKIRVKVLERSSGDFLAVPNVSVLNRTSREPESIAGLGRTAEDAVHDLLDRFVEEAREQTPLGGLTESDFGWDTPEDF